MEKKIIPFFSKGQIGNFKSPINRNLMDVLNQLQEEAEGSANFDPDNFDPDNFDSDDLEEDIYSLNPQKKIAAIKRAILKNKVRKNEVAQVDVKIERLGVGAGGTLPFALFGHREQPTQYRQVISAPAGYVYDGFTIDVDGNIVFSFTPPALPSELVRVSCPDYPYASLVLASAFDVFRIRKIRYSISDQTQLTQFSNKFEVRDRTIFGKDDKNSLSVASSRNPENQQVGILDINQTFRIDGETSLINSIIPVNTFSVNMSLFIDKVSRRNANNL